MSREHAVHDQVADDDAERGAQERVDAAPVAARPNIAAFGSPGGRPLEHDLPEEQHQNGDDVEPVREERAVAGIRALLGVHPADRQDHVVSFARKQISAAGAPVDQQPLPVACRRSISAQSGGPEQATSFAVSFSTQRKAGMSSFEPSRMPAWLAPVCDERSVSHSAKR